MQCPNCLGYRHDGACPPVYRDPTREEMEGWSAEVDHSDTITRVHPRHQEPQGAIVAYGVELCRLVLTMALVAACVFLAKVLT